MLHYARVRVAVRPCFAPGASGGIEQYVQGLAGGLSRLEGADRFDFVGTGPQGRALADHIAGDAAWVTVSSPSRVLQHRIASTPLGPAARRVELWARAVRSRVAGPTTLPESPSMIEDGGYDVVHFAAQSGERTRLANLYQPWDLQHLHYPEYFSPRDLERREATWGPCCKQATFVLVASHFVRDDVVEAYGIDPSRVAVVPPGAPLLVVPVPTHVGEPYALYPAQQWGHKNHVRLIDAIASLRARGTEVKVVCTGQPNARDRTVRDHARARGVEHLIEFRGYVSEDQLACLYEGARCLVFPSLFEGFGFPVLEAFAAGVPVACAEATSLPELAGDAAVFFDPTEVDAIAGGLERVWVDEPLRQVLVERGRVRAQGYSWDGLARSCRALYRAAAGHELGDDDAALLSAAGIVA
jgi:glycosyltransferase involved in cell wall biosynthesis